MTITIKKIKAVRRMALRKRIWYKNLDYLERGIVNLSIKLVENIKSPLLARTIAEIIINIQKFFNDEFIVQVRNYGYNKMREVIHIAERLGCKEAFGWACEGYARFLTLNNMYSPIGWRHPND